MHISKRDTISLSKAWSIRAIAILLALIVDGIIIYAIVKMNPLKVYVSLASGAFGTSKRMWFTIRDCMILTCIAIGLAPAFKMRFWNVGAEGQMLVGGIATAFWMINFAGKMNIVMLFLCMAISAIVAGGIWGLIPGFFKAKWNTNETLFTLMMNYIAIQLTSFAVSKWENPPGSNSIGTINSKGDVKYVGWIGNMFSDGYNKDFMWTVIIVLVLAALVYLYLKYTKHGYEIAVVGESENTAHYIGIDVKKVIIRTMALSGAICGLAGLLLVGGSSHSIDSNLVDGRGFTAIMVSWLAKFDPFTMILTTLLLVFLARGADEVTSKFGLNSDFSEILTGIILFFIIGCEFFINYKVQFRTSGKKEA